MKARFPLSVATLVAVLSILPSGCSDDKPEGPKNNPQRNTSVNPGSAGEGTGTFGAKGASQAQQGAKEGQPNPNPQPQPGQSATVTAVLTYEVCQGAKDGQPGQCTTGNSPCTGTLVIPLERSTEDGSLTGSAEVTQNVGSDLVLTGKVVLTQSSDGSYLLDSSVSDNHHPDAIAHQQQAGNGPLDKMAAFKVESGKQAQADGSYAFDLTVGGSGGDVPACPSPTGSPTPPEQVPPSQGPAPLPETSPAPSAAPSASPSAAPSASPSAAPSASPAPVPLPVPIPTASVVAS